MKKKTFILVTILYREFNQMRAEQTLRETNERMDEDEARAEYAKFVDTNTIVMVFQIDDEGVTTVINRELPESDAYEMLFHHV